MSESIEQALTTAYEHFSEGRWQGTEATCRDILARDPRHAGALHLLGLLAHRTGRLDAAVTLLRRAIESDARRPEYHTNLGVVLSTQGRGAEAIVACRAALSLDPNVAEAHFNLGNALRQTGALAAAADAYRDALTLRFEYPEAHQNLGNVLRATGALDDAARAYRDALRLQPGNAFLWSNLGIVLLDAGQVAEALVAHRQAVAIAPENPQVHGNLIVALQHDPEVPDAALREECERWDARHAARFARTAVPHDNDPDPERMLRIGLVCPELRLPAVGAFVWPLLTGRDPARVHVTCYSIAGTHGAGAFADATDAWCDASVMDDDALADRIRDDAIDVLVDLVGYGADSRLLVFARRPAPVQMTYLGMGTTGLAAVNARFTDAVVDPPAEGNGPFTETPARLATGAWCFAPPPVDLQVTALPALRNGYVTFGVAGDLASLSLQTLDLCAAVLQRLPNARLRLASPALGSASVRERYFNYLAGRGVTRERVDIATEDPTRGRHLAGLAGIDVALDTFPCNGRMTTCEALWMGVPVVTLQGSRRASRVGASLLTHADLADLVAHSPEAFVERAVMLASDLDALAECRASLRPRFEASALMDPWRFAQSFEDACRERFRAWAPQAPSR